MRSTLPPQSIGRRATLAAALAVIAVFASSTVVRAAAPASQDARPSVVHAEEAAPASASEQWLEVPGGRLWVEVAGAGEPLVFLHDGLLPSTTWDAQFPLFAQRFRAVRYDRRGYGRSEPSKGASSDLDDLLAVLDRLTIQRATLVGCSNGSKLAVDFALAHPERVKALVLAGPVVSGFPASEHFSRRGLLNFKPQFSAHDGAAVIENWVADPYLTAAENSQAKARLRELLTAHPEPALGKAREGTAVDRPALGRLGEIHLPTLILVGERDIPDVQAQAGVLEAGIARARRVILPQAGHLVQMEQPAAFNALVLTFLQPEEEAARFLRSFDGAAQSAVGLKLLESPRDAPLDLREGTREERGGATVVDCSYASPLGGRVPAYLVLPRVESESSAQSRHPAVLFVHPGQGNRSTFLDEAVALAAHGVVSLTLDAPFARPGFARPRGPWDPEQGRHDQLQAMLDVRRGFDLLAARPEVDPTRLAYVGHSFGATIGGTLAGVEHRPLAWVLMAGYPAYTHAWQTGGDPGGVAFRAILSPAQRQAYLDAIAPFDALPYLAHARGTILFQFAERDEFITPWDAALFPLATAAPHEVRHYDGGHALNPQARSERDEWLLRALAAGPPRSATPTSPVQASTELARPVK